MKPKYRILSFIIITLLFSKGVHAYPEFEGPKGNPDFSKLHVQDHILVAFPRNTQRSLVNNVAKQSHCKVLKRIGSLDIYLFSLPPGLNVAATHQRIKKDPRIKWVLPDYLRTPAYTVLGPPPNDPYYIDGGTQFNVSKMQVDLMWNTAIMMPWAKGTTQTVIAIIDSGINSSHEDFAGKLMPGWNVLNGSSNIADTNGHGTLVASVAASTANNSKGIAGLAWNPMLLPVKFTNWTGDATDANAAAAIDWATANGASVINCSWGGPVAGAAETAIFDAYYLHGIPTIGGGPDSATDMDITPNYPASLPFVISTGCSDASDNWAGFAYGNVLKCVAPAPVWFAYIGSSTAYSAGTGTSISTPQIAAFTALLLSNEVPYYESVSRIAYTADKVGPNSAQYTYSPSPPDPHAFNQYFGYGRANFYRAMQTLVPPTLNSAVPGMNQVALSWSAPALTLWPTSGYNVYRSTTSGGPYTLLASPGNVLNYTDNAASGGTNYYYSVKAADGTVGFETKASNELSAIPLLPTPTNTPSCTVTPTFSFSPTSSPTSTATPTLTATPTFSFSPTRSSTPTATSSHSFSPTPSLSFTISSTPSPTPTFTVTQPLPTPQAGTAGYMFPQPASGEKVTLVYSLGQAGLARAYVYNQAGNLVAKVEGAGQARPDNKFELKIEGWGWGIYYLVLEVDGERRAPIRFVVGK